MEKRYRVLNITDGAMGLNQKIIVITLSEVEYPVEVLREIGYYSFYPTEGQFFIVDYYSDLAKRIIELAKQEQVVTIDHSQFILKNEYQKGKLEKVFYHSSTKKT